MKTSVPSPKGYADLDRKNFLSCFKNKKPKKDNNLKEIFEVIGEIKNCF